MNKDLFDERLMSQQAYLRSRNLKEPTVIYENLCQEELFKKYGLKVNMKDINDLSVWAKKQNYFYLGGFMTKENGHCDYMEFNKKRMILDELLNLKSGKKSAHSIEKKDKVLIIDNIISII